MGISLCMIVKNEEDWVLGAVESVRSIVDEVIIVDTGSTDATATRASALLDADERLAPRDLPYIKDATRGDADGYHLIQLKRATGLALIHCMFIWNWETCILQQASWKRPEANMPGV